MSAAFAFLLSRSFKNFIRWRLQRLREPRYAIVTLAGAAYLWLIWGRYLFAGRHGHAMNALGAFPIARYGDIAELFATLGLGISIAIAWLWPHTTAALRFSQAEIQFFFPAPVSRRALIHYKLVRSQVVLVIGAAVASMVIGGRLWQPSTWPFTFGIWLVLMTMNLHFLALGLLRTGLTQHGVSALRGALATIVVAVAFLLAVAYGAWHAWPVIHAQFPNGFLPVAWAAVRESHHGVLAVVLWPLRAVVRPAFSQGPVAFLLRLPAALLIMALHYLWVLRSDAAFEEASVDAAERQAARVAQRRLGRNRPRVSPGAKRVAPFALAPTGRPEVALLWKNLIASSRSLRPQIIIRVLAVPLIVFLIASRGTSLLGWQLASGALAVFAAILLILGPNMLRSDFRTDLLELETLKTWPLSGSAMVVGELAVPVLILTALDWFVLLMLLLVLPRANVNFLDASTRTALILAAMMVAPCVGLVGVLIQNAAVLLFPGWFSLGANRPTGLEATGQRMLTALGSLLAMVLLVLGPAVAALIAILLSRSWLGPWSYTLGGLMAAICLAGEAGAGVLLLGRVFERLDPSREGILPA